MTINTTLAGELHASAPTLGSDLTRISAVANILFLSVYRTSSIQGRIVPHLGDCSWRNVSVAGSGAEFYTNEEVVSDYSTYIYQFLTRINGYTGVICELSSPSLLCHHSRRPHTQTATTRRFLHSRPGMSLARTWVKRDTLQLPGRRKSRS